MVGLLPRLTLDGIGDYLGLAIGASLAFGIFVPAMASLSDNLRKNGGA
jgi:hypothetical protein